MEQVVKHNETNVLKLNKFFKEIDRGIEKLKMLSLEKFNSDKIQIERDVILCCLKNKLIVCKSIIKDDQVSYINLFNEKISIISKMELSINSKKKSIDINVLTNETQLLMSDICTFKLYHEPSNSSTFSSLNKDVVQINSIFKDLHSMIETQGENIDKIEQSVIKVNNDVIKSEELIKESEVLQSRGLKGKIIAGFFIVIATISTFIGFKI